MVSGVRVSDTIVGTRGGFELEKSLPGKPSEAERDYPRSWTRVSTKYVISHSSRFRYCSSALPAPIHAAGNTCVFVTP